MSAFDDGIIKSDYYSLLPKNNLKNPICLTDPEKFGIWADVCGKTLLFGNKFVRKAFYYWSQSRQTFFQMNWTQSSDMCCSLGMDPIIFSSSEEQQCIANFTSSRETAIFCTGQPFLIKFLYTRSEVERKFELLDRRYAVV
jgi:hypothetical protein